MGDLRFRPLKEHSSIGGSTPEGFPPPPVPTRSWWRRRWRRFDLIVAAVLGGMVAVGVLVDKALPHELLSVDFRRGVAPFEVGEAAGGKASFVGGTYHLFVSETNTPISTVGELVRTAYAVGVRAEFVEMTGSDAYVGAMCLGPVEGAAGVAGYGFFAKPGGDFILARQDASQRIVPLKQGTVPGIEPLERVSIACVPNGDGDVALTGYANGLEIVTADDPGGYRVYTYAGLAVVAEETGIEVRFTRVWARLPDGEWIP